MNCAEKSFFKEKFAAVLENRSVPKFHSDLENIMGPWIGMAEAFVSFD